MLHKNPIFPLLLLLPSLLLAQQKPIKISGNIGIYYENHKYNDTLNFKDERPPQIYRLELSPSLTLFNAPIISLSAFISNEGSKLRQEINRFQFNFNISQLKDKVRIPFILRPFSLISIGRTQTEFTEYTLYSTPLDGINVEFLPSIFYLNFAYGISQRAVEGSDSSKPTYKRTIYGFKTGLGKKDKTHLHFIFLHAKDDENSIKPYLIPNPIDSLDTLELVKPKENTLLGVEPQLSLWEEKFILKFEFSSSYITDDIREPVIDVGIPDWLKNFVNPRPSSSLGFAYKGNLNLNFNNTQLNTYFGRVEPSYKTLGNEYLRNDEERMGLGFSQNLLERKLGLDLNIEFYRDNVSNLNSFTTKAQNYEGGISLNIENFPSIDIKGGLFIMDTGKSEVRNLLNVSSGHRFKIKSINFSPFISYGLQNEKYLSSHSVYLNNRISFPFNLSFDLGANFISSYGDSSYSLILYLGAVNYTFLKRFRNSFGIRQISNENEKRSDLYYSLGIDIPFLGNFNFKLEQNQYNAINKKFNEFRIVSSILKSF